MMITLEYSSQERMNYNKHCKVDTSTVFEVAEKTICINIKIFIQSLQTA